LAPLAPHGVLVLPSPHALATPDVFREADRLGLGRSSDELAQRRAQLLVALAADARDPVPADSARATTVSPLPPELLVNDLERAARSLCPSIDDALAAARAAGADHALVSGSGPTVVGLFCGAGGPAAAEAAARELAARFPGATASQPVDAAFAAVRGLWHDEDRP
ncbi:MAG TPA: hypothetical protein VFG31_03210, partial [Conexibacter sp.]|nr:hypothetical protein [Conexibacter sp.]